MPRRYFATVIALVLILVALSGCTERVVPTEEPGIKIITTLFPQYDFVRQIGGDKVSVSLLLPPGVESHSYEPSPRDIVDIHKADIFIFTGEQMEPWVVRLIQGAAGKSLRIVDSSIGIDMLDGEHEDDEHEGDEHEGEDDDHPRGGVDPHIWLDPLNAIKMVQTIVDALVEVDPDNAQFYIERAKTYQAELQELHDSIDHALSSLTNRTILYAGHFAFGYFAHRYDLHHISPYTGFAPDAEPTPQRIAELIKNVNASASKVIYYEELVDPKVARVISEQTGAKMVLLHGAHNVSRDELASNVTYLEIMRNNVDKLLKGLKTE